MRGLLPAAPASGSVVGLGFVGGTVMHCTDVCGHLSHHSSLSSLSLLTFALSTRTVLFHRQRALLLRRAVTFIFCGGGPPDPTISISFIGNPFRMGPTSRVSFANCPSYKVSILYSKKTTLPPRTCISTFLNDKLVAAQRAGTLGYALQQRSLYVAQ